VTREFPIGEIVHVSRARSIVFSEPAEVVCTCALEEVRDCLERVNAAVEQGMHAAGWVAYEAAPAFDSALVAHPPTEFPLVWFRLFRRKEIISRSGESRGSFNVGEWRPSVERGQYIHSVSKIRDYIAAGDTYQVNYTFPLESEFSGDERAWFDALCGAQQADHFRFADDGR